MYDEISIAWQICYRWHNIFDTTIESMQTMMWPLHNQLRISNCHWRLRNEQHFKPAHNILYKLHSLIYFSPYCSPSPWTPRNARLDVKTCIIFGRSALGHTKKQHKTLGKKPVPPQRESATHAQKIKTWWCYDDSWPAGLTCIINWIFNVYTWVYVLNAHIKPLDRYQDTGRKLGCRVLYNTITPVMMILSKPSSAVMKK